MTAKEQTQHLSKLDSFIEKQKARIEKLKKKCDGDCKKLKK
jgi:hypothetical protein